MSQRHRNRPGRLTVHANIFAALGDETRLNLVGRLCHGGAQSITSLSEKSALTRQAITKHLRVLEEAGVVSSIRQGRETKFAFKPEAIASARTYLEDVSRYWDDTLARLKAFVET